MTDSLSPCYRYYYMIQREEELCKKTTWSSLACTLGSEILYNFGKNEKILSMMCRELAYWILSAALSTASSFRIWNSSTGILSLPGASVRNSAHGKGHEEGGSAYAKAGYAKAGSSLRSPPGNSRASTPQYQSLPTFCFVLSPTPLTLWGAVPHYLSLKKELAYSSS